MDQKNSIVTNIYTIKLGRALKLIKAKSDINIDELEKKYLTKGTYIEIIGKNNLLHQLANPPSYYGKIVNVEKKEITIDEYNSLPIIKYTSNDREENDTIKELQNEINRLNIKLSEAIKDRDSYKKAYKDLIKRKQKEIENKDIESKDIESKNIEKEYKDKEQLKDIYNSLYNVYKELFL